MNSFMSWVGGKKALRDAVLARFPPYYERYIEVFGGARWVLFHKPPGADFEIFNDFNSNQEPTAEKSLCKHQIFICCWQNDLNKY